ncbi:MAG: cytochrome c3 family protein [Myxococcota bacterium]
MRARRLVPTLLVGVLAAPAVAIDLERLVMPGELAAAHAEFESDCGSCHARFDRSSQDALCLDCHEEVAADRAASTGFHGRVSTSRDAACAVCHTDHQGREADIRGLDLGAFDHRFTDHPLRGAHQGLDCRACHEEGMAFRDAPGACVDCHAEVEPHDGRLGSDCADCHDERAWSHVSGFDHGETGFVLEGRHADARCGACHPAERWADTPSACVDCHRGQDAHRGSFGPDCGTCHDPGGWKAEGFDHDRDTRFPLAGAHARASCAGCHRQNPREEATPRDCLSCHAADDEHRAGNGPDCGACHGVASWARVHFDHDRDTGFRLAGAHRDVRCASCHAGPPAEVATDPECAACHASGDVHRGQLGRDCAACHGEAGWRSVRFDHEITRFPLLGLHAVASCEQCHATQAFHDAPTDCASCHASDDVHRGALGASCDDCHNPNDWGIWSFDHALETRFPLEDAHAGLACGACHQAPMGADGMRRDCGACHRRDDVHRGALGNDCGRCHEATRWREVHVR